MLVHISVMTIQQLQQRLHRLFPQLQNSEVAKLAEDQNFIEFLKQARSYEFVYIANPGGYSKHAIQLVSYNNIVKVYPLE